MRRNFLRSFLAAAVIGVFFQVSAYAESAVVVGNRVNLRAGPGINYYVLATLDSGTTVEVVDRSNSAWYTVVYGGQTGFISSSYLGLQDNSYQFTPEYSFIVPSLDYSQYALATPSVPATAPVVTVPDGSGSSSSGQAGYINAMYVRFRSGPSSGYSVLGTYSTGKAVTILGQADGWTACLIDGQTGYVYSQYVSAGNYGSGYTGAVGFDGISVQNGQTSSGQASPALPLPNESGIVVVNPTVTPAPVPTPIPTPAPVLTPTPTSAPIVVVTPSPTTAPVLPSPLVPAPVTTPSANSPTAQRANLTAYISGSYVRFRSGPGTNYSILGTYNTGKTIAVHSRAGNGWLFATIDGVDGYVYENYVLIANQGSFGSSSGSSQQGANNSQSGGMTVVQPVVTPTPTPNTSSSKAAYITGNNVRFRAEPSMNSKVLDELFYGNAVSLHAVQADWALVTYNGQTGYVYAQYVKAGSYNTSTPSQSGSGTNGSATGQDIVNYALKYVGYKYRWGGSSPSTGFDCSGFVYYVYSQFGYTLNRVAQDQASNGVHVEPSAIQPGDIICFYSGSSYIGHVGIYIGGGRFVHASNSTTGVIISELSGYYSTRGYEVRRIAA